MGGLFVATVLTLIVLPALYVIFFRVQEDGNGRGSSSEHALG
jgi:Cu/Ag efflux pump CusA